MGVFTPLSTPTPRGYDCRIIPATLVAKGIYDQGYSMMEIYKNWGYTQNYDLFGWNAESYFKEDPISYKWTNISPVSKI